MTLLFILSYIPENLSSQGSKNTNYLHRFNYAIMPIYTSCDHSIMTMHQTINRATLRIISLLNNRPCSVGLYYCASLYCCCQFLWMCEAWWAMGDLGQARVRRQLRRSKDSSGKKHK